LDDAYAKAYVAHVSGSVAIFRGELLNAITFSEEAIAGHREVGDTGGVLSTLFQLAVASSLVGDADRAAAACEESFRISEAHGERWGRSYALWALALHRWLQHDTQAAVSLARESLAIKQGFHDQVGAALDIEVLAWIAASGGRFEHAARLLGAASAIWHALGTAMSAFGPQLTDHHDQCERRASRALGERTFRAAFDEGARLTAVQAIACALEDKPAASSPAPDGRVPLTHREWEVAKLIAQGLSNKEIAATLVISLRTAEGHVEHILTKLGFTSRAQVATWMAEERAASRTD
jgi:non-specific serine/threonine protein kinase